ncbi:tRNA (guanosine(46)-N7)-methyltransferase TrmB [Fusibacter ferrireducens]|uniref:tRNA (guanine-N(7)-)-methyltransferase n=1 Tax=Fusibacter ferrireducens TaxID=2785058 RepID=A0ABR9ZYX0_9FIRM|nr:tRNA (guanosine(46)-N7)-methyltransferase TrmB [Fusibacter ferrireducens]MBF4695647.1 tRNA (guanosine(46)-N7)-methyltransferase TrmB [Fusibacter ferrireducens]
MRVRKIRGAFEELVTYDQVFVVDPASKKGKWHEVFGNDHDIHAEFGGGKGRFIIEMAKRHPNVNFIMVDVITEVILKAAQRADKVKLPNLKMIMIDLREVDAFFEANELSRIYLNFSDPWPKKKHYKRRLTYRDFMKKYQVVLKDEGWIHFKTDNKALFEFSLNEFCALDMIMKHIALDLHAQNDSDNIMTEYEEKFSSKGFHIYRVEAKFRN